MQKLLNTFFEISKEINLNINVQKTVYGIIGYKNEDVSLKINNSILKNIGEVGTKYLGFHIKYPFNKNDFHIEKLNEKSLNSIKNLLATIINPNKNINIKSARNMYLSLIRPILTYGAEVTYLSKKNSTILESTQMYFFKRFFHYQKVLHIPY